MPGRSVNPPLAGTKGRSLAELMIENQRLADKGYGLYKWLRNTVL